MRAHQMVMDLREPRQTWRAVAPKDSKRIQCSRHYRASEPCGAPATQCLTLRWNTGNTSGISFFYYCDAGRASVEQAEQQVGTGVAPSGSTEAAKDASLVASASAVSETTNQNLHAYRNGSRYRLEHFNPGNASRLGHELVATKAQARRRRAELRRVGFDATIFEITSEGGLRVAAF
jgi:hypothetical protein